MVPKKAQPREVGDLRPITVLNVDGKLLSRVLARRLETLNGKLLHPMQVRGGAGQRTMQGALLDLRDALAAVHLQSRDKDSTAAACMVSLDIAGAFNTVRHDYLWGLLTDRGVPMRLVALLQSAYQAGTASVRVNGELSTPIQLQRGVRQGCPLSMALFNMATQPLVARLDEKLSGIIHTMAHSIRRPAAQVVRQGDRQGSPSVHLGGGTC